MFSQQSLFIYCKKCGGAASNVRMFAYVHHCLMCILSPEDHLLSAKVIRILMKIEARDD